MIQEEEIAGFAILESCVKVKKRESIMMQENKHNGTVLHVPPFYYLFHSVARSGYTFLP